MKLRDLLANTESIHLTGSGEIEITGIDYDSRRIKPGMMFVAIDGFKMDGNQFIPDAIKNGAAVVMTENPIEIDVPVIVTSSIRKDMADLAAKFFDYPGKKMRFTGVTGTNGKSTSVSIIRNILNCSGIKTGMMNSLIYDTGEKEYKAERTTPDSVDTQKLLADMVTAGCSDCVIEVSSHALMLNRVDNIDFKVGLFTNFSRDHLDFHKTMEEYLEAKKLFLDKLESDDNRAVINIDVPEFAGFLPDVKCQYFTWSTKTRTANISAVDIELSADHSAFTLITPDGNESINLALPGRYNLENAVGAAAAGIALGIEKDIVARGLNSAKPVPGRFQPIKTGQPFSVIIDFAHTPDALRRLILSAREITAGRVLTLFGCGGDRDRGKRPLMGQVVTQNSDLAVLTSDNPRTESPDQIIDDVKPGMVGEAFEIIKNRSEAVSRIINLAAPGDVVLIAGKGAEEYQEIGDRKYPYQDKLEILKALEALGYHRNN